MKKNVIRTIGFLIIFGAIPLRAQSKIEYIYPVATIMHENKTKICVLHQKEHHLELLLWDPETSIAIKTLLSSYTPAGLRVLPSKNSFSFIDNDRIKIKEMQKRSTRSIDIYGPYNMSTIEWIDDSSFYFSAYQKNRAALFYATIDSDMYPIISSPLYDYMYPQKIDNFLFCIRKEIGSRSIDFVQIAIQTDFLKKQAEKTSFDSAQDEISSGQEEILDPIEGNFEQVLCTWNERDFEPIFLHMINEKQGFFLAHAMTVVPVDKNIHFFYCSFSKDVMDRWSIEFLFNFDLPLELLIAKRSNGVKNDVERLYESILPLLPVINKNTVFYHSMNADGLEIFSYDLIKKEKKQITKSSFFHYYFSPFFYNEKIYYGQMLQKTEDPLHMDEDGVLKLSMPSIDK